ncbi:MAG: serine/threonine-protein kinase [bacterium]
MSTQQPFDDVWQTLRYRDQLKTLEASATLSLEQRGLSGGAVGVLPSVGHLVQMGAPLGAGGNGEVFEAGQDPLPRTIAVKRPVEGGGNRERLLQEARVIGFLEHPSIPPIHFVGGGESGELLLGLKRIDGETLGAKLRRERVQGSLDENIDILIQICNAVGYAHSRGVVHQDLKPDNIMTGQFGQVYVLDWGLALAIRDDVPAGIPRPDPNAGLRGTPAFVAPESIVNGALSPATDVYQLGGILHMMLTGDPPNAGETVMDALRAAYEPPMRQFPLQTPASLAEICRRALSPDPLERFPDAHSLHESLLEYRRRRGLIEAEVNARQTLANLRHAIDDQADPNAVYQAYGAARGAAEVLGQLGGAATHSLQTVLNLVIGWELDRRNLGGAEVLLSELSPPDPDVVQKCEALRGALELEKREVSKLRDDMDTTLDVRSKAMFTMGLGTAIGVLQFVPHALGVVQTVDTALYSYLAYLALLTIASAFFYRKVNETRINRAVMLAIWQLSVFGLICRVGGALGILPLFAVVGYDLVAVTLTNMFFAAVLDRRIYASAPIYAVASVVCFSHPQSPMLVFGFAHFLGLNTLAIVMLFGGRLGNRLTD